MLIGAAVARIEERLLHRLTVEAEGGKLVDLVDHLSEVNLGCVGFLDGDRGGHGVEEGGGKYFEAHSCFDFINYSSL